MVKISTQQFCSHNMLSLVSKKKMVIFAYCLKFNGHIGVVLMCWVNQIWLVYGSIHCINLGNW